MTKRRQFDKLDPELLTLMEYERQAEEITDTMTWIFDKANTQREALRRISVAKSLEDAVKIAVDALAARQPDPEGP
jgi:hypothetical protein